jgi:hypothetical protein
MVEDGQRSFRTANLLRHFFGFKHRGGHAVPIFFEPTPVLAVASVSWPAVGYTAGVRCSSANRG